MLVGMTGFGQGTSEDACSKVTVQIQSVNRKFCEITVNLPRELASLETRVSREVSRKVLRGYVTVSVNIENKDSDNIDVRFNKKLAKKYVTGLKEIASELKLAPTIELSELLRLPEVVSVKHQPRLLAAPKIWPCLNRALSAALKDFYVMRTHEGQQIFKDLGQRIDKIERITKDAQRQVAQTVRDFRALMVKNLSELAAKEIKGLESAVDKEVASFAERIDTAEELKRLEIHLKHFREVMRGKNGSLGRKLDFITQEINREINTLSSKSNDIKISKMAVEAKSELDKIREQLQNVE